MMIYEHERGTQRSLFDIERTPRIPADVCANRHKGNAASAEANPSAERKSEMHKRILAYLNFMGRTWLHDLCREFNKKPNEISGRLSEMKALGLIEETGEREERCAVLRCRKA